MDPVTLGVAAVGIGSSIMGGLSANKKAKEAAKDQAELTGRMRDEEIRQKLRAGEYQQGAARAGVGASNIQFKGTAKQYLNALDFENMREVAFAREAKKREQEAIRAGARGAGDSLFYQAAGDAIGLAVQGFMNRTPATDTSSFGGPATPDFSPVYQSGERGGGGLYNSTPYTHLEQLA